MAKAVKFDKYGDRDVLYIDDVEVPIPGPDEVVVHVMVAGLNPGEAAIRQGFMEEMYPGTFPSGEGTDCAGVISAVASDVTNVRVGDEVIAWSQERSSQAQYVKLPSHQTVPKPAHMSWEVAGSFFISATTAYAAAHAVEPKDGDTIAVSAPAGGVGVVLVQYLKTMDVNVIGIASEANSEWLTSKGMIPVPYGDNLKERLEAAAPDGISAFIDLFGPQYVDLALDLGVKPERINTIIAFQRAGEVGAKAIGGASAGTQEVVTEMAKLVADGMIEVPIAATYPIDEVKQAYKELEERHTGGKIVLSMD